MIYFDFNNLIDKYSCDFTILTQKQDEYDELGEKISKNRTRDLRGAVIGINDSKIYRSDGVLTAKDKELFVKESLGDIQNAIIIYDGNQYHVESNPQNNHQFTGVWQYTLKWLSAFKGGDKLD